MRRDASTPPGGRSRWMPVCGVLTAALTACGTPPPVTDEEPGTASAASDAADAAEAADGGAADEAPLSVALAPSCPDIPERSYQPPPEEQPPADPAQTTAEVILDLPVEEPAEPEIIELDDGEEIRIAPEAPQTVVGELQEAGEVEWPDHFGGVWADRGAMIVGFTDDVERYAELVRERYGAAWWVVEVEHSERELRELQEEIDRTEFDPNYGPGSVSTTSSGNGPLNRVTLGIIEPSDDRLAELSERYGADRICFEIAPTPTGESWPPWWAADDAAAEPRSVPIAWASLVHGDERQLSLSVLGCNADHDVQIEETASEVTAAVTARNGTDDCLDDVVIDLASPLAGRPLIDALRDEEVVVHGGR
jgi:hypothetical protein